MLLCKINSYTLKYWNGNIPKLNLDIRGWDFKVFCLNLKQTSLLLIFLWFFQQVSNNGWAEGECKGKAGWFPFGYIERRERVLASKVAEVF